MGDVCTSSNEFLSLVWDLILILCSSHVVPSVIVSIRKLCCTVWTDREETRIDINISWYNNELFSSLKKPLFSIVNDSVCWKEKVKGSFAPYFEGKENYCKRKTTTQNTILVWNILFWSNLWILGKYIELLLVWLIHLFWDLRT